MADRRHRRRRMAPHAWEPLTMTWGEVAQAVFRASELWLRGHMQDYPDFPVPTEELFHAGAVRDWCDRRWRAELPTGDTQEDVTDLLIRRAQGGQRKNPASRRTAA